MMKSRKKEFKRKYFGSLTHQLILISICLDYGNTSFVLVYQHGFFRTVLCDQ